MKSLKITHFFDVIKKEVQSDDEREVSSTINESSDVKQEYVYKEELDISWNEGEHDFDSVEENRHSVNDSSHKLGNPRILLERLPDNVVKNAANKYFCNTKYNNEPESLDAKVSERKSFHQHYQRFCTACKKREPSKQRTQKCKNCKIPWNYECKKCSKKLSSYGGITNHLNVECLEKGNYYKCSKCNYQSIDKYRVNRHLKTVHSAVNSLDHIEMFESENVQKDVMSTAKSHRCSKCGKKFRVLPTFLRHTQVCGQANDNVKKFSATANAVQDNCLHCCVKCNQTVKNDKVGTFHQKKCRNCHSKFSFKCKKCERIFHSYNGINQHLKIRHTVSNDVFKCPECDYETPFFSYLTKHLRRKHTLETHECPKCGQKYKNRDAFKNHSLFCKKEPQFQCDHCSYKTNRKALLTRHMLDVHSTGNEVDCPQCGITLKNNNCLTTHIKYCKKEPHHQCNSCSFKTKYKYDLTKHYESVHCKAQKKETCPKCAKECKNKHALRTHVNRCGKFTEISCKYCHRLFKGKQQLKQHIIRAHSEDNNIDIAYNHPYLHCDDCLYKTKFKGDLVKHVITHLENNAKECPTCKKHFKNEYFKKHAEFCGKEPLRCDLCDYRSLSKECLKRHIINIHSKGNEIDCSKCGRTCKNQSYLRAHLQRCGTNPHLQCDHCSYKTKYKYVLKKHIEKNHTKKRRLV